MTAKPTARQRACPHPTRRPLIGATYERCADCGLILRATIAAPWILEYEQAQPEAPAPDLFPARDQQTYIAESNQSNQRSQRRGDAQPMSRNRPPWMPPKPASKREQTRQRIEDCRRQARYVLDLIKREEYGAARNEQETLAVWLDSLAELTS